MLAPEASRAVVAREAARADLGRFIAACYYEPAPAFAEEGLFGSMAAAAAVVDPELEALARRLGAAFAGADLQDLLVDYTHLFLGPVDAQAQPYASVWLGGENELMQDDTLAVLRLYEEGGFEIDDAFQDLPDHVAVELEFLYLLLFRENEARLAADVAAGQAWADLRRRFLDGHLGLWLGPFLRAMHEHARCGFYETLAELTEAFVRQAALRHEG